MSPKTVAYILAWLLLSASAVAFYILSDINRELEARIQGLESQIRQIQRNKSYVAELSRFVKEAGIPKLTEEEASKRLALEIERLKNKFELQGEVGDFSKEGNTLKVELSLKIYPDSSQEMSDILRQLMQSRSPIIEIYDMELQTSQKGTVLNLRLRLIQPFFGENAIKAG